MLKAYRASTHIGGNLSEIGLMYADPASRDKPDQSDNWTTLNVSADNRASYPRIITNSYVRPPDRNIGETRRAPGSVLGATGFEMVCARFYGTARFQNGRATSPQA